MVETYTVRVEGVRFSAAHFATYRGGCEPLHGHSYEVIGEVAGSLTDDSWVVDFTELKAVLRGIARELDHRFMLQARSRVLDVLETEPAWKVRTPAGLGYVFPKADVVALPVDNSTAERLAQWFSGRVWEALQERLLANVDSVIIEICEGPGQRASHRRDSLSLE